MSRYLSKVRTEAQMLDELERSDVPGVLELCKLYRAAVSTNRAQREVIAEHVRTIVELKKR